LPPDIVGVHRSHGDWARLGLDPNSRRTDSRVGIPVVAQDSTASLKFANQLAHPGSSWSFWTPAGLFLLGLALYWPHPQPLSAVPNGPESILIAKNLVQAHQFANPFSTLKTGPTAHLAPLFPTYLALLFKIFGLGSKGMAAVEFSAVVSIALNVAVLPYVSKQLSMGYWNGVIAGLLWLIARPDVYYVWEASYTAVVLAVTCCVFRKCLEDIAANERSIWLFGVLAGLLVLINPATGLVLAIYTMWKLTRDGPAAPVKYISALLLIPLLLVFPWIVRNYKVFHTFVPIRDNLGLELSISNSDCAQVTYLDNVKFRCFQRLHPNGNVRIAKQIATIGEPQFSNLCLRRAGGWAAQNPDRFLWLTTRRFLAFWIPTFDRQIRIDKWIMAKKIIICTLTLLSGVGVALLFQKDPKSAAVLMILLLVFPLLYYLDQVDDRYRLPVLWATFLAGSFPLSHAIEQLGPNPARETKNRRKKSAAAPGKRRHSGRSENRGK
jgi:hypothetical protein